MKIPQGFSVIFKGQYFQLPYPAIDNPDFREEPRNLATRVMSNGVEVIVAGDKTTYPGDKDFKRVLPTNQKAVTLKPSTLTDHMLLVLPQETPSVCIKFN